MSAWRMVSFREDRVIAAAGWAYHVLPAAITLDDISGTRTSVYCGSFSNDYNAMTSKDLAQYPNYAVTGSGNAMLSNRISYCYNLHGPSVVIDTACSSSLTSFHLANRSLQDGESDISIVAGTALHFDPNIFITMTDLGMLSSDGRCRAFDADGSGYVRGEGVCAVVLKRRSDAQSAGDPIKAIIRGTGANHDGRKDGLLVPNGKAQAQLLRKTYKDAGLSTADTHYFEVNNTHCLLDGEGQMLTTWEGAWDRYKGRRSRGSSGHRCRLCARKRSTVDGWLH